MRIAEKISTHTNIKLKKEKWNLFFRIVFVISTLPDRICDFYLGVAFLTLVMKQPAGRLSNLKRKTGKFFDLSKTDSILYYNNNYNQLY